MAASCHRPTSRQFAKQICGSVIRPLRGRMTQAGTHVPVRLVTEADGAARHLLAACLFLTHTRAKKAFTNPSLPDGVSKLPPSHEPPICKAIWRLGHSPASRTNDTGGDLRPRPPRCRGGWRCAPPAYTRSFPRANARKKGYHKSFASGRCQQAATVPRAANLQSKLAARSFARFAGE